jgi:WD40 repeat protein
MECSVCAVCALCMMCVCSLFVCSLVCAAVSDTDLLVCATNKPALAIWDTQPPPASSSSSSSSSAHVPVCHLHGHSLWVYCVTALHSPPPPHASAVHRTSFTSNSNANPTKPQWLVSGSRDRSLCVWDLQTALTSPSPPASTSSPAPASAALAVTIPNAHSDTIYCLLALPYGDSSQSQSSGRRAYWGGFVSGSVDGTIKVWSAVPRCECVATIRVHSKAVYALALCAPTPPPPPPSSSFFAASGGGGGSGGGYTIASASADGTIVIVDLDEFIPPTPSTPSAAAAPPSPSAPKKPSPASASTSAPADVSRVRQVLTGHSGSVFCLATISSLPCPPPTRRPSATTAPAPAPAPASPTGSASSSSSSSSSAFSSVVASGAEQGMQRRLVSGGYDTTVRIWNVETGECLRTLAHSGHLSPLPSSPSFASLVLLFLPLAIILLI